MISEVKAKVVDAILSSSLCKTHFSEATVTEIFALNDRVLLSVMKTVLKSIGVHHRDKETLLKLTEEFEAQIAVEEMLSAPVDQ